MKDLDEQISTPKSAKKRLTIRRITSGVVALLLLVAVIGGGAAGSAATFYWISTHGAPTLMAAPHTTVISRQVSANLAATDVTAIYQSASPAIVSITSVTASSRSRRAPQGEAGGTGFIVNDQGNILTNYHVVQGASKISVTLLDGTTVDATVAGSDPGSDLALLTANIPKEKIVVATLGNSDTVQPGEPAVAIGNPFGLDHTITSGIISAVNREFGTANGMPLRGLIQTDAPINPGNSGGPLFDAQGEVIGITASIESPVQGSVGIGFAIPINKAKQLLPKLQTGQNVDHPYLGIQGGAITADLTAIHSFPVNSGVLVVQVDPGGPADKAGIKGGDPNSSGVPATGDIITEVDGQVVKTISEISGYLATKAVGDKVTLTVMRDSKTIKVDVTLGAWPASQQSSDIPSAPVHSA